MVGFAGDPYNRTIGLKAHAFGLTSNRHRQPHLATLHVDNRCTVDILVRDEQGRTILADVERFRIGTAGEDPGDLPCRDVHGGHPILALIGRQFFAFLVGHGRRALGRSAECHEHRLSARRNPYAAWTSADRDCCYHAISTGVDDREFLRIFISDVSQLA
jgi:hypothetical protein